MAFPLLALAAGAAVLGGTISGVSSARARKLGYEDKLEDLKRQEKLLDQQFNQAKESYELSVEHAGGILAQENKELDILAGQTEENRARQLSQAKRLGEDESTLRAREISQLAVENELTEGKAVQQAATSGFRGSGTVQRGVENVQRSSAYLMRSARQQAQLSNYQMYSSAVNNYVSQTQQIEQYQRRQEYNIADHERQIEELDLQMEQAEGQYELQGGFLGSDIKYMRNEGKTAMRWAQAADISSGVLGGAFQGLMSLS